MRLAATALPDTVMHGGVFFSDQSQEKHRQYYEAGMACTYNSYDEAIPQDEQFAMGQSAVRDILSRGNLIDELAACIDRNGGKSEPVTLVYSSRHPTPERPYRNVLPIIMADEVKDALTARGYRVTTQPMFHRNKVSRAQLNPFQRLVCRSVFEPPGVSGKALILDDDILSGMSSAEMHHTLAAEGAEIIGIASSIAYDGGEHLRLRPKTGELLLAALVENGGPQAPAIFTEALTALGIEAGIDGLTNMEAAFLVSRLSEPARAQHDVDAIWKDLGYDSMQTTNDKFTQNRYCIWNDYFENDAQYQDPNLHGHVLQRSAQRGKIDFHEGVKSMLALAKENALASERQR